MRRTHKGGGDGISQSDAESAAPQGRVALPLTQGSRWRLRSAVLGAAVVGIFFLLSSPGLKPEVVGGETQARGLQNSSDHSDGGRKAAQPQSFDEATSEAPVTATRPPRLRGTNEGTNSEPGLEGSAGDSAHLPVDDGASRAAHLGASSTSASRGGPHRDVAEVPPPFHAAGGTEVNHVSPFDDPELEPLFRGGDPSFYEFRTAGAMQATAEALRIAPRGNAVGDDRFDPAGHFFPPEGWVDMPNYPPESRFVAPNGQRAQAVPADVAEHDPAEDDASAHRACIIVPFREGGGEGARQSGSGRWANLREFVPYMADHLTRHLGTDGFRLIVVEQAEGGAFNKGALMDIGFLLTFHECDYFVFHDVDQLPTSQKNTYGFPLLGPTHLCTGTDAKGFTPYPTLVGGVLVMSTDQFWLAAGYGSNFWGWGIEDDDMYRRIQHRVTNFNGYRLQRPDPDIGAYHALPHKSVAGRDVSPQYQRSREIASRGRYQSGGGKANGLWSLPDWLVEHESRGAEASSSLGLGHGAAELRQLAHYRIRFHPDVIVHID